MALVQLKQVRNNQTPVEKWLKDIIMERLNFKVHH